MDRQLTEAMDSFTFFMKKCEYQKNQDVAGAIAHLSEALAKDPKNRQLRSKVNYLRHGSIQKGMSFTNIADRAGAVSVIRHTSLQDEKGNDRWTWTIGEAFIRRGEEFERRGQLVEAMSDYISALSFDYNADVPCDSRYTENKPDYDCQVHGRLEWVHNVLREVFGPGGRDSHFARECKFLSGYIVVICGVVVGQFPLDDYGREEAIDFANEIAADEEIRWQAVAKFGDVTFDESEDPVVFEHSGHGRPKLIHSANDIQDQAEAP